MGTILDRIKEPSTHAGIAAMLQAMSYFFPAYAVIFNGLTAVFAGTAMATKG